MPALELWGGPECTLNRVEDRFSDQFRASGHEARIEDLDLFADLGLAAIRYPILWERIAPDRPDERDWRWSDARMARLRSLALRPIVGLVHHGSGPRYTNLLDDGFAIGLAEHAAAVARRYPWVTDWTPVNEPLTTARFSALYGVWYPHHRDERSFWLALLNQIDGVRLSMAAVRRVNPSARLIQTDDLGRTYATVALGDQAAFDNVRRWIGWDLLCGRVVPGHALWQRLCDAGFEMRLRAIAEAPCPPDVIGINHYLTSDRFLDHRLQRYPAHLHGDNGRRRFADTEAVRVLDPPPPGLRGVVREAWERYRLPIAITEVHNGCTREEQMRWMADAWCAAGELRSEGVDVCAVTAWSLLGSCDWDTLLTREGRYEPGVYDVGSGRPQPTAMVPLLRAIANGKATPALCSGEGWWQRPIRLHHGIVPRPATMAERKRAPDWRRAAPPALLLVGDGEPLDVVEARCRIRGLRTVRTVAEQAGRSSPARIWGMVTADVPTPMLQAYCRARAIPLASLVDAGSEPDALLDRLIDAAVLANGAPPLQSDAA